MVSQGVLNTHVQDPFFFLLLSLCCNHYISFLSFSLFGIHLPDDSYPFVKAKGGIPNHAYSDRQQYQPYQTCCQSTLTFSPELI